MKNLKTIQRDMDYIVEAKIFSGRMTKKRFKVIDSYSRQISGSRNCGHDYDCCGCVSSVYTEFVKNWNNNYSLIITTSFNY